MDREGGWFGGVGRSWGFKWKHFKCAISLAQGKSSICSHAKQKFGPEFAFGEQKQVQFLGPFKTQIPPLSVSKQDLPIYYRVTPKVRGISKRKGLEQGSIVEFSSAFWECPPFAGSIAKNEPKAIKNPNIHNYPRIMHVIYQAPNSPRILMHVWGYRTCQSCNWKMLQNL